MSAGWEVVEDEVFDGRVHVHPLEDLIAHDLIGEDCVCSPRHEAVDGCDCGEDHLMLIHSSLDGREAREQRRILLLDARIVGAAFVTLELARLGWRRWRRR